MGYKRVPKLNVRLYRRLHPKAINTLIPSLISKEEGGVDHPDLPIATTMAIAAPGPFSKAWWIAAAIVVVATVLACSF